MSDVLPLGVGDPYSYPNWDSYRAGGGGRAGTTLQKGIIWALGTRLVQKTVNTGPTQTESTITYMREVDTKYYKRFQYNPPEVSMAMNALATDPPGTQLSGGNITGAAVSMGSMTISLELLFTREDEVFRAENNLGGARMNDAMLAVYKRVGVQKDIYDLYRILSASDTTKISAGGTPAADGSLPDANNYFTGDALPSDPTMASLTGKVFDLAATGSWVLQRAVAVQLGDTNIFYGWVTSLSVKYNKFNYRLVPTWASVSLGLDVMAARPSSASTPSVWSGGTDTTSSDGSGTPGASVTPLSNIAAGVVAMT